MLTYTRSSQTYYLDWRIKRNPVYRLLDNRKWVDNFFEKGEIQLSCFKNFKDNEDEFQGDKDEGESCMILTDEKNTTHFIAYEGGMNAQILCTTEKLDKKVITDFNGKYAIKINDPTMFALEISRKIPFFISGLEGTCDYVEFRSAHFDRQLKTDKVLHALKNSNIEEYKKLMYELTLNMELFSKHNKYRHQCEYRFIWFNQKSQSASKIITCPEAVEYCEIIEL